MMKPNEHENREKLINAIIDLLRCLSMDRLRKLYITALVWAEKEKKPSFNRELLKMRLPIFYFSSDKAL